MICYQSILPRQSEPKQPPRVLCAACYGEPARPGCKSCSDICANILRAHANVVRAKRRPK